MAASSCCLLFIVAVILSMAIEGGKKGIRLYKICEFVEHKRMRGIVTWIHKYSRCNLCGSYCFCLYTAISI